MIGESHNKVDWAKVFIYCNVIFSVYLYLVTEGLSLFKALTRGNIIIAWLIFFVAVGVLLTIKRKKITSSLREIKNVKLNKIIIFELSIIALMVIVLGFLAWNIVPYNPDSMTYHCSRVMNWAQNQSVDYYPTNIPRQLYSPPFMEYNLLHMFLIMQSDVAFNMVQWYGYVAVAVMMYVVCRKLDMKKEVSLVASMLAMSMPIAIAESVTTQTDLYAATWLLYFVYIVIDFAYMDRIWLSREVFVEGIMSGCIVGLGYLSKSQICIPMMILFLWMALVRVIKKDNIQTLCLLAVSAGVCLLPFLLPTFARNYEYTGSIFASSYFQNIAIGSHKPAMLIMNFIKNMAQTSISYVNSFQNIVLLKLVHMVSNVLGVNIDDRRISYTSPFDESWINDYGCDCATAPFIGIGFIMAVIASVFLLVMHIRKKQRFGIKIGFIVFLFVSVIISVIEIRWQATIARLLIPTYMLMILFSVLIFTHVAERFAGDWLIKAFTIILPIILLYTSESAIAYQWYLYSRYRESGDRFEMHFGDASVYENYSNLVEYVREKEYTQIGIYLWPNAYEYPLWVALKNDDTRIIQVTPGNIDAIEQPECIIVVRRENVENGFEKGDKLDYLGNTYVCNYKSNDSIYYTVLERDNSN